MSDASTEFCLLYVTCPSEEVARSLGKEAVSERLAACANILPTMFSVYEWKGSLVEETEVVLLLKTRTSLLERLRRELEARHPYEVPCLVELPIRSGNATYLEYLRSQTHSGEEEGVGRVP